MPVRKGPRGKRSSNGGTRTLRIEKLIDELRERVVKVEGPRGPIRGQLRAILDEYAMIMRPFLPPSDAGFGDWVCLKRIRWP